MKALLVLQNGIVLEGEPFGSTGTKVGEVVFSTGMVGYEETLTDPNFYGQIITQSYPLIGNYGINGEDGESAHVWVFGYIVREVCDAPSNFRCKMTLSDYLKQEGIVGMSGVDTRRLVRLIRDTGVMNAAITTEYASAEEALGDRGLIEAIRNYKVTNAVKAVGTTTAETFHSGGGIKLALLDYGHRRSLLRSLVKRDCQVTVLPANTPCSQLKALGFDGIVLSNGPGDPCENPVLIENLKEIARLGLPIFGVGLGHQMMALAQGAATEKLAHGHRGANQPVTDLAAGRTHITYQNHGYTVVAGSLPEHAGTVSHVNANDATVEGIRYSAFNGITVQYLPEGNCGPRDTDDLFDEFVALCAKKEA